MRTPMYGAVTEANVRDTLLRVDQLLMPTYFGILRGLDSSRSVSDLVKILNFHRVQHDVEGGNVCLSLRALRRAVHEGVFTGFDEVWISEGKRPSDELSSLISCTSDVSDFSMQLPEGFQDVMEHVSCVLAIGDGLGLNYATFLPEMQKAILDMG